jgi:predicted acetylornithine/succinylornithine family transaminase
MSFDKIKQIDEKHYVSVFSRLPVALSHGKGCTLYDVEGKAYVDFLGGIATNCLGYSDAGLIDAISAQAARLIHTSNLFYSPVTAELVRLLTEDGDFDRVFLSNSGGEANEAMIKLVRKYWFERGKSKPKFVSMQNSFHGRTLATATLTGQEKYSKMYKPLPEGFVYVPFNDKVALEAALSDKAVGALVIELIQGEGGVIPIERDYLKLAKRLCEKNDVVLVADEIQTGVGRTGKMYAYRHFDVKPDIITLAKGLGGGVPIGATLAVERIASAFKAGDHGSTFGGNPLAAAAACTVLDRLKNTDLLSVVAKTGDYLNAALCTLKKYKLVKGVRGIGLLQGLMLDESVSGKSIVNLMLSKGFIINCAGNNTLRFVPPYIITKAEIDKMVAALDGVFKELSI